LALKVTDSPEKEGLAEETRIVVLVAGLTFWFIGALWCGWKLPSPNMPPTGCGCRSQRCRSKLRYASAQRCVAQHIASIEKVTLPVGVGSHLRVAATVAVRVTASP